MDKIFYNPRTNLLNDSDESDIEMNKYTLDASEDISEFSTSEYRRLMQENKKLRSKNKFNSIKLQLENESVIRLENKYLSAMEFMRKYKAKYFLEHSTINMRLQFLVICQFIIILMFIVGLTISTVATIQYT